MLPRARKASEASLFEPVLAKRGRKRERSDRKGLKSEAFGQKKAEARPQKRSFWPSEGHGEASKAKLLAKPRPGSAKRGRKSEALGRFRPVSAGFEEIQPISVDFDENHRFWAKMGRKWPKMGLFGPILSRFHRF